MSSKRSDAGALDMGAHTSPPDRRFVSEVQRCSNIGPSSGSQRNNKSGQ